MKNAKIGAAVLSGYVLGRTKKAKLALSLGALLAGSRIKPGQLGKVMEESPFLSNVSQQVRTELAGASKAAATSVLTAKADSLADALHERTAGLREKTHAEREQGPDEEREQGRDEEADREHREKRRGDGHRGARQEGTAGQEKKSHHRGSGHEGGEPRKQRTAGAQGPPKSGSARSRRPDDG
ncbi:ABC transporter substrate-binding protein [Streptomyces sp. NPDC007264]|uniref:ABC transporter substrate-binding protein n=1 Tax=Streptomyces sp. NPDC007264 TaxID=3364777 RepID=UPI0036DB583E